MAKPRKIALLVGIREYSRDLSTLEGCLNDIDLLEGVLTTGFQFEVRKLAGKKATRDNIVKGFEAVRQDVSGHDGSTVVFHFSGHGRQVFAGADSIEEADMISETLVPYDVLDIIDDELFIVVGNLIKAANRVHVFCIVDACHSGSVLRGDTAGVRRAPPRPAPQGVEFLTRWPPAQKPQKGPSKWLPKYDGQAAYTLLAACMDGQEAGQIMVRSGEERKQYGALTYSLVQELEFMQRCPQRWTYQMLFERIHGRVLSCRSNQDPQLEGARNQLVFAGQWEEPRRYFHVSEIFGKKVTVHGGRVHGLGKGTVLKVDGHYNIDNQPTKSLGTAEIVKEPGISSCYAILGQEPDEQGFLRSGQATVLEYGVESEDFRVGMVVDNGLPKVLVEAVEKNPLLRRVRKPEEAKIWIHLDANNQVWLCSPPEGYLLLEKPWEANDPRIAEDILEPLTKIARYYNVIDLRNPDPTAELAGNVVTLELRRVGESKTLNPVEGGDYAVQVGEEVQLYLVNNFEMPLYVSVLQCLQNGGVQLLYPGAEGIHDNKVPGGLSEGMPIGAFLAEPPLGKIVLKLIATMQPIDFRVVMQAGLEGLQLRGGSEKLLQFFKGVVNGFQARSKIRKREIWGTHMLTLWIVDSSTTLSELASSHPRCWDLMSEES